jgi:hypothetical protein
MFFSLVLEDKEFEPDDPETILAAFKVTLFGSSVTHTRRPAYGSGG